MPVAFYVCIALFALLFIASVILIFRVRKVRRFSYVHGGRLFVAEVRGIGAKLFMNGNIVDEFEGRGVKTCMLKTFINGDEFSVRISFGPFAKAEAFLNGKKLEKGVR